METTKACLARAKAHGLKFSIEQHTHCLVPDAASFLRLWDQIRDDDLGYNSTWAGRCSSGSTRRWRFTRSAGT